MAIAEHAPSKLNTKNKGLLKMTGDQLHDFAATPRKGLPQYAPKSKGKFKLAIIFSLFLLGGSLQASPVYNATAAPILQSGVAFTVWSAETPTPGNGTTAASQQVALQAQPGKNGTPFGVDGKFSGTPGSFEVDVQVAATDSDTSYQTCSSCNITTVDSTNNTFHLDAWGVNAKFARLLMRARGNSVTITASVTGG